MNITQYSFALPVLLQLALEGRQEYLKIKEISLNYNIKKPLSVKFWLICEDTNGKSYDISYNKSKSTDSEIYFLLPSDMFVVLTKYHCIFKLQINQTIDFSMEDFTITVSPKSQKKSSN